MLPVMPLYTGLDWLLGGLGLDMPSCAWRPAACKNLLTPDEHGGEGGGVQCATYAPSNRNASRTDQVHDVCACNMQDTVPVLV